MQFERFGDHYVLRLDPGEEAKETLLDFANREQIRGGYFLAFGAFSRVALCYFDIEAKQYRENDVNRQVEVVSLLGNIGRDGEEPLIHAHTVVADAEARTYSGHLGKGYVRPTLEVFLTKFEGEVRRRNDPATGLPLLALGEGGQPA